MMHIDEMTHPLDIRDSPTDPALVDLQPFRDAAHDDRLQRERRQAERKREYMRAKYEGHGTITRTIKQNRDVLMITGNRLLNNPYIIREKLCDLINMRQPDIAICGMAIGADQLFAEVCIEKEIPMHAYIPFRGQENRWPAKAQKRYKEILSRCDKQIIVCATPSKNAFFKRNAAMVRATSRAVVVWDGKKGGTANTIKLLENEGIVHWFIEN